MSDANPQELGLLLHPGGTPADLEAWARSWLLSPPCIQSPDLLWLLLLGLLENILFRASSLSVFQFDGDSAYVGMSDGNPELLSTSQVGAPSFLSWVGVGYLALGWLEPSCFWGGRGTEWGPQPTTVLFQNN